jgi:glycine cleavage system H protein
VHALVSFIPLEGNEAAEDQPGRISRDPYGDGWMERVRPTDWAAERQLLVDVAEARLD